MKQIMLNFDKFEQELGEGVNTYHFGVVFVFVSQSGPKVCKILVRQACANHC
jgi:hypothetical protein